MRQRHRERETVRCEIGRLSQTERVGERDSNRDGKID